MLRDKVCLIKSPFAQFLPSPVIVYEVSAAASPGSPVGLSLFTGAAVVYAPEHNHRSFHKSSTNLKSLTTVDQPLKQYTALASEKCTMHVFTISTPDISDQGRTKVEQLYLCYVPLMLCNR